MESLILQRSRRIRRRCRCLEGVALPQMIELTHFALVQHIGEGPPFVEKGTLWSLAALLLQELPAILPVSVSCADFMGRCWSVAPNNSIRGRVLVLIRNEDVEVEQNADFSDFTERSEPEL